MIYTKPLMFRGIQDIKDNIEIYSENFRDNGIIVFREANLEQQEQDELTSIFGAALNFYPNSLSDDMDRYTEDHSRNPNVSKTPKDQPIIPWHIEKTWFDNPIVAATWNMKIFDLEPDSGETWFVNSTELFQSLSQEDQDFLKKCVIITDSIFIDVEEIREAFEETQKPLTTKVIGSHWLSQEPVIRMSFLRDFTEKLYSFDNRRPDLEEQEKYNKLRLKIVDQLDQNLKNRIVHQWKQGDVVIPDLHRMIHTVGGGVDPTKRQFTGIWCYQNHFNTYPRLDMEYRLSQDYDVFN